MSRTLVKGIVSSALCLALYGCGGGSQSALPPTATSASVTVDEDNAVSFSLSGQANNNGTLSYTVTGQPKNGTISVSGNNVTYTPNQDYFGTDSLTFRVTEGELSSSATVSIDVAPINDAPTAIATNFTMDEDGEYQGQLVGEDVDDTALTFSISERPTNGTLTTADDGSFTYVPNEHYYGEDSFSFVALDSELQSVAATTLITIDSVNDAPVFDQTSTPVALAIETSEVVSIAATDIEDSDLTYRVTSETIKDVDVTNNNDGQLTIAPKNGSWGQHQIQVEVADSVAATDTATITLDISVPDSTATLTEQSLDSNGFQLDAKTFVEHDGFLYHYASSDGDFATSSPNAYQNPYLIKTTPSLEIVETIKLADYLSQSHDVAMAVSGTKINIVSTLVRTQLKGATPYNKVSYQSYDLSTGTLDSTLTDLPFSASHSSTNSVVKYVDTLGFVIAANDGHTHIVNNDGVLTHSILPESGAVSDVSNVYLKDMKIINGELFTLSGGINCSDEDCTGGSGNITLFHKVNTDTGTSTLLQKYGTFPKSGRIDSNGNAIIADNYGVMSVSLDNQTLWSQTFNDTYVYSVMNIANDDIFVIAANGNDNFPTSETIKAQAMRITQEGAIVWSTEPELAISGYLFGSELVTDQVGNLYFVGGDNQEYAAGDTHMRLFVSHIDYTGKLQWTKRSLEAVSMYSGTSHGKSKLTSDGRLIVTSTNNSKWSEDPALNMFQVSIQR